jgi:DNA-binding XRE family transcriptional regulator
MPRPPSKSHPLREIRNVLGLSQVELARRVGCKAITIKKIEAGTLQPGDRLAKKLAAETDTYPHMLLDPAARITDTAGRPLTIESHREKIDRTRRTSQKQVDYFVKLFSMMIQALFDASLESPKPKIYHVLNALMDSIDDIKNDFGLIGEVEQILPKPDPLFRSWAASIVDAAQQKRIPMKLDPLARSERYRKRRETIKLKKGESPKKPSRRPLLPGSGNA